MRATKTPVSVGKMPNGGHRGANVGRVNTRVLPNGCGMVLGGVVLQVPMTPVLTGRMVTMDLSNVKFVPVVN
jgi:hypothetical protein